MRQSFAKDCNSQKSSSSPSWSSSLGVQEILKSSYAEFPVPVLFLASKVLYQGRRSVQRRSGMNSKFHNNIVKGSKLKLAETAKLRGSTIGRTSISSGLIIIKYKPKMTKG